MKKKTNSLSFIKENKLVTTRKRKTCDYMKIKETGMERVGLGDILSFIKKGIEGKNWRAEQ